MSVSSEVVELEEKKERDLTDKGKRKGKVGRFPVRTHWNEDELNKKELMVKCPIKKRDVIGGRKMVFFQYKSELYNPNGVNFAGRRRSEKTSEYRGVYWNKNHKKWEVKLKIAGKTISLGYEKTEEGAARRYDRFITKFIINRLGVNFPEDAGGVKLTVADLVSEGEETLEETEKQAEDKKSRKVQDLMLDFGLDSKEEVSEGCQEWPGSIKSDDSEE